MNQDPSVAISRRAFLVAGLLGVSSLVLAGCETKSASPRPTPEDPTPTPSPSEATASLEAPGSVVPSTPASSAAVESAPAVISSSANVESLQQSSNNIVQGLGELEERSGGRKIFDGVMQFLDVDEGAVGDWQLLGLQQSVRAGLAPLSIVELTDDRGRSLDLAHPTANKAAIDLYFTTLFDSLKQAGVKIEDLGPFALCPEFINGFDGPPGQYAANLNVFLNSIHAAAPDAHASNMIDLGEADLLLPTLKDVNSKLLRSIGIQAFADDLKIPFDSAGKADVSGFLEAGKIKTVISALGNKPMWLNTGIIRKDANPDVNTTYTIAQRIAIADAIANVVTQLKKDGVDILTVNLFAENKYNGYDPNDSHANAEKRDFSFHPGDEKILLTFAGKMQALGISLSGFALPHDLATK